MSPKVDGDGFQGAASTRQVNKNLIRVTSAKTNSSPSSRL
jgi:hypothetical protein